MVFFRLLKRQNLSGLGGPNHVGGELQTISVSCQIFSHSVSMVIAQDTFQHPNQTFWGTASDGLIWGGDVNSKASFSINNNAGKISVGSAANLNAVLESATANAEILFSGSMSIIDNHNSMGSVLRWTGNKSFYRALINGSSLIVQKI